MNTNKLKGNILNSLIIIIFSINLISCTKADKTAEELCSEYKGNSIGFADKYDNNKISVSGEIVTINQNLDMIVVTLKGGTCKVEFGFKPTDEKARSIIKELKSGNKVVIKGLYVIYDIQDQSLYFEECEFISY